MTNREKKNLIVKGIAISYKRINEDDYICLTDIARAKNQKEPKDVIKNWMRLRSTIEYLSLWENFYNPIFKGVEIDPLLSETGKNHFTHSPNRWIEDFNSIGMIPKKGTIGGTYAHKDIAFKFASWVSVEFEFYLIKEFQRLKENDEDYICLTDMAKFKKVVDPRFVVYNWLKNKETLQFLSLWETINNSKFNRIEFDTVTRDAGTNSFMITPNQWVEKLDGIGIFVKCGKNGGTYAHKDIAFEFASWLSPEFKLYLITEFQRLKKIENNNLEWNAKRELAKVNYHIHTSSIKENLIVPQLSKEQIYFTYASEADLLNVALFGITASEWRSNNKELKGNIRDYASIEQLLILANMESYNAMLIEQGLDSKDRIVLLNNMAKSQMKVLQENNSKRLIK